MTRFRTTIEVAAPPQRVWQVMIDTDRWHEWTPSVTSVERLDDGPFAVGSRTRIRQPKLPPAVWTVTAIEPGRRFTWISRSPGLRVVATHAIEPTAGGSRVTLSVDLDGILAGVFGRITGGITERYIGFEARGLKARSEDPAFSL